mmetsp:Transcript_7643/g.16721  ORF Transcript_7643/g.16721 Transcript_7643/m.16721 type:complete len:182 (+) Transcript_7643:288-833(+)|eukprot:CAMPEP_0203764726 /NCGR_PEP_ID=MMETSP0098-20131031/18002_1 /ASSEMBLY_ACC=CAM_ASM_000208 /TAXON_ID=96639 /ORGANISM=" , Strain NY0313808BC1" /LENGTH=181 /DNA_ID=CAMNT_0050660879 /DNA_START=234 /DNA_END=779 /DNA_ORIENTATION=+
METGNIAGWTLKEGEAISAGSPVCEIETDKATVDFEAQDDGFLAKILMDAGASDVPVGTPIGVVVEEEADIAAFANFTAADAGVDAPAAPKAPEPAKAPEPTPAPKAPEPAPAAPAPVAPAPAAAPAAPAPAAPAPAAVPLPKVSYPKTSSPLDFFINNTKKDYVAAYGTTLMERIPSKEE